jgi:hypothetical protein
MLPEKNGMALTVQILNPIAIICFLKIGTKNGGLMEDRAKWRTHRPKSEVNRGHVPKLTKLEDIGGYGGHCGNLDLQKNERIMVFYILY